MACCGNCNSQNQVKVKRTEDHSILLPSYKTAGAACFDLSVQRIISQNSSAHDGITHCVAGTGFAFEIPEGHVMMIYIRSSIGCKKNVTLSNNVGVIDSDYRGEVMISLDIPTWQEWRPEVGERVAQAMIVPVEQASIIEVSELSDTERGEGGFGSTGKQ